MIKDFNIEKIDLRRHLLVWTLITTYFCILDPVKGSMIVQIPVTFLIMFNYMLIFYVLGIFILPQFWKRNLLLLLVSIIILFLIFCLIDYLNFYYLKPLLGGKAPKRAPLHFLTLNSLMAFTFTGVPAAAYYSSNLSIQKIKYQNDREKYLLTTELNFLKNQFNSHITFNFLNYCYSRVHKISHSTAEAIDIFSNMLRYSLQGNPSEKVSVLGEIEYIKNFIELQKLLTSQVCVSFTYVDNLENKMIIPRILITLVENAFKHGQLDCKTFPILITLTVEGNYLHFKVSNKKHNRKSIGSTGLGQDNMKQILMLYYPNNYQLDIEEDQEKYICELNFKLNS